MDGWRTKPLGELLQKTETVNPAQFPDEEFDYIDVSSVSNENYAVEATQRLKGRDAPSRARRRVRSGDVLFATIRPTLKRVAVIPPELDGQVCSTGYFVLRPSNEIDHRFLFYALFTEQFMGAMESLQKGASYPAVTDAEVRSQPLSFPALSEQKRIVTVLDEAFEGIATAKANAEKNLQNARDLFTHHRETLLATQTGWCEALLGDLCTIKHGYAFEGEFFSASGEYVLLTPGSFFEAGGYRERGDKTKYFVGPIPKDYVLSEGDLLVAMTEQAAGLLGSPLLVPESGRFLHNQRLGLVEGQAGVPWSNEFFFHVFNLMRVRQEIHASASGAKVRHTSPGKIGLVRVAYPDSMDVQQRIAAQLVELADECDRIEGIYQRKLTSHDELKKSLLHQAFSGQL